jgi:hypothetical protein
MYFTFSIFRHGFPFIFYDYIIRILDGVWIFLLSFNVIMGDNAVMIITIFNR